MYPSGRVLCHSNTKQVRWTTTLSDQFDTTESHKKGNALGKHLELALHGFQMGILILKKIYLVRIFQDLYYITPKCTLPVEILFLTPKVLLRGKRT